MSRFRVSFGTRACQISVAPVVLTLMATYALAQDAGGPVVSQAQMGVGQAAAAPPSNYGALLLPFLIVVFVGTFAAQFAVQAISDFKPSYLKVLLPNALAAGVSLLILGLVAVSLNARTGFPEIILFLIVYVIAGGIVLGRKLEIAGGDGATGEVLGTKRGFLVALASMASSLIVLFIALILFLG